jgi:hypothetical protein
MKIFLCHCHIKLRLIKCWVKAMAKTNLKGFQYLSKKFPDISTAKLKQSIFMGPQIWEILEGEAFVETLTDIGWTTWESFKCVCSNFLHGKKSPDFSGGVQKLMKAHTEMGCHMSLKVHFLHSHLGYFSENLDEVSDEQGERFYRDIKSMEHCYQGFWNGCRVAYYCWMFYCDAPDMVYHRRRK